MLRSAGSFEASGRSAGHVFEPFGGEAVLYYHGSADGAQLAHVLEEALGDRALRARLAKAARARAAKFTWDRTSAGIASVIREVVA